jgi:hypothetical protein
MHKFGLIKQTDEENIAEAQTHIGNVYASIMDRESLWDPDTIEKILKTFPKDYIEESDLFLILAECIANAVLHGQAEALGFHARERTGILLLTFHQIPPMQPRIVTVLKMAREGRIRECAQDLPGGLGFPILLRMVHKITTSGDLTRLQLWIRR